MAGTKKKSGTVRLDTLHENPKNPNHMTDARYQALKKSLNDAPKLLTVNPIVVRPADGMILSGNHRYRALVDLGYKEVPERWIRYADELNEEEERRAVVVLNEIFGKMSAEELLEEFGADTLGDWGLEVDRLLDEIGKAGGKSGADAEADGDEEDADGEINAETGFRYKEQYGVIVMCKDEAEQQKTYERLVGEGFSCKVVAV